VSSSLPGPLHEGAGLYFPPPLAEREPFPWLNVLLFLATILTTLFFGMLQMVAFDGSDQAFREGLLPALRTDPSLLLEGLPFSLALIAILLSHEMGHYLTCRYYGIRATLPYFIPAPTLVGTFGAFIRIRSPIQHRAALLEVGIAGPIAGFLVALPVLVLSMTQARYVPLDSDLVTGGISLGDPLIFKLVEWLMGTAPPDGMELYLHPIGFAAWVGFLVTALNLLPVGQLDGGHVAYALSRRAHRIISRAFVFGLIPMGIWFWPGWLVWAVLLLFLGVRHPPTLDDAQPLESRQTLLGWVGLAMFILCFTPTPVSF
jgi:membrane-associated protease RseP (regulator of RpoE activity)